MKYKTKPETVKYLFLLIKIKYIIYAGDKGTFTLNPEIFWKGDAQTRKQVLEGKSLKISYELI